MKARKLAMDILTARQAAFHKFGYDGLYPGDAPKFLHLSTEYGMEDLDRLISEL